LGVGCDAAEVFAGLRGGGAGVVPPGLDKEPELAVNDGLGDDGLEADLRQPGRFGFGEVLAVEGRDLEGPRLAADPSSGKAGGRAVGEVVQEPNPGTAYAFRLKAQRRTPGGITRFGGKAERIPGGEPVGVTA
jgi:hypothetical protein